MARESYPQPHEIVTSQAMTRQTAFSEGQAKNVGGGVWTIRRRQRGTGQGGPATEITLTSQQPIWVSKGAWSLPGGVEQPLEGFRYVANPGVIKVDDQIESVERPGLRFTIITVEGETGFLEGKCRLIP